MIKNTLNSITNQNVLRLCNKTQQNAQFLLNFIIAKKFLKTKKYQRN